MNPQNDISKEQVEPEAVHLQEHFCDGFQDTSLPAAQVLIEQEEARKSNERAPLLAPERTSLGYIP